MRYRGLSRTSGQSLVEFALIAVVLLTLLLGVVDFGLAYSSQIAIRNAIAEGGYYAIQHPDDAGGIEAAIDKELASRPYIQKVGSLTIAQCVTDPVGAKETTIQGTYEHNLLFSYIVPGMKVTLRGQTAVPQLGC
jgi:Flp pilus assembly protein TadG